ncbi:hypothetical protein CDAR_527461 [Caerostris darwini]|uniref:Uncharacterized protein n=1 Tax=Caerostris darwini TaxID=1538125 RepID=A0AAV4WM69_9ARAC|nr:hypothetical protein CDAR_527461 [Caerostris darwini]
MKVDQKHGISEGYFAEKRLFEFRLLCSSTETRPGDSTTRKDFAQKILSNRSKAIVVRVPVCVINGSSLPFSAPRGFYPTQLPPSSRLGLTVVVERDKVE